MNCLANTDRLRGYKIEIYPTDEQKEVINKFINIYRGAYNLIKEIQDRDRTSYINIFEMKKIISDMRNNDPKYEWLKDISMSILREVIMDADNAYKQFFNSNHNYPRFKSKKTSKKSFTTRSDRCYSLEGYIQISGLPRNINKVCAKSHNIPIGSKMYGTTITYDEHGRYYFSCQIEKECVYVDSYNEPIGIDVGIRNMITTSDGDVYHMPDNKKLEKRIKRQQRRLAKYYKKYLGEAIRTRTKYEDVPKSKNMQKKLDLFYKTNRKIVNRDMNAIHNATKSIVSKNPSTIVIEDIKVTELRKRSWFNRLPQSYFYEICRQLEYKAADRNINIIVADSNFPSSQICSNCGSRHKVHGNKVFSCPVCGLRLDRDLNAAYNLRELAYR